MHYKKKAFSNNDEGIPQSALHKILIFTLFLFVELSTLHAQVNMNISNENTVTISEDMRLYISGNWINNGTFIAGSSTVYFNGTDTQTIDHTSNESYNNMTIDKSAGSVQLDCSVEILGAISLATGKEPVLHLIR